MYYHGRSSLGHEFKNSLIEDEYGILKKPETAGSLQANYISKRIHQVLANLVRRFELDNNYVDEDDPWKGILVTSAFNILCSFHTTNKKPPVQLVFGIDMILPIEHLSNWRLLYQRKQILINKNTDRENITISNHHFRVGDQVLTRNNQVKI